LRRIYGDWVCGDEGAVMKQLEPVTLVAVVALAQLVVGCVAPRAVESRSPLVGTWRLVEDWDRKRPADPKEYPFGEHPLGYIVYDASGHVFVQFTRDPPLPKMESEALDRASAVELQDTVDSYVAYLGTYTVDWQRKVIVHHVQADSRREYTGTDQERPFKLSGDELLIGDGETWLRRLVRVPDTPAGAHASCAKKSTISTATANQRAIVTEQCALAATSLATDPTISRDMPERLPAPVTMWSIPCSSAYLTIAVPGSRPLTATARVSARPAALATAVAASSILRTSASSHSGTLGDIPPVMRMLLARNVSWAPVTFANWTA
jgi:hypothetical protein